MTFSLFSELSGLPWYTYLCLAGALLLVAILVIAIVKAAKANKPSGSRPMAPRRWYMAPCV